MPEPDWFYVKPAVPHLEPRPNLKIWTPAAWKCRMDAPASISRNAGTLLRHSQAGAGEREMAFGLRRFMSSFSRLGQVSPSGSVVRYQGVRKLRLNFVGFTDRRKFSRPGASRPVLPLLFQARRAC